MSDTDRAVDEQYRRRLLCLLPGERIQMASGMFDAARTLIRGRLLRESPRLSEADLRVLLFEQIYGREFSDEARRRITEALRDPMPRPE